MQAMQAFFSRKVYAFPDSSCMACRPFPLINIERSTGPPSSRPCIFLAHIDLPKRVLKLCSGGGGGEVKLSPGGGGVCVIEAHGLRRCVSCHCGSPLFQP